MNTGCLTSGQKKKQLKQTVIIMTVVQSKYIGTNPEFNLLREERIQLKHDQGCAVCASKGEASVFGHWPCRFLNRRPLPNEKYCHEWQLED